MAAERKIYIFDTTLRDGEQSPGASLTPDEKLKIARELERLNVDVIEAGFAMASDGDFEAVKAIALDPLMGEEKRGDLQGVFVYKFKLNNQETLLAYELNPNKATPEAVVLLGIGPHENFYTLLKR